MTPDLDNLSEPAPSQPTLRTATEEDVAPLRVFLADVAEAGATMLDRHLERPRHRPDFTRLAEAGGRIVGCAFVAHQRLRLGPATVEAGLVELFVQEAQHEAGVFAALVGDTLRTLLENGLPLALVARADPRLAEFCFAPVQLTCLTAGWNAARDGVSRTPAEDDLDDLAALYQATSATLPWSESRAAPDWRFWLSQSQHVRVIDDGRGRVAGYAQVVDGVVVEAAAADAGAARKLLAALGDAHTLRLPLAHPLVQAALHTGGSAKIDAASTLTAAAGVVDLPSALEQLVPTFEQRLERSRYAGWSGNLRVEIDTERVTLASVDGRAEVIDGSRPADLRLRRVTLPALAQLYFGYRAVSDLRATADLDCDDSALGLLECLFPVV